MIGQGRRTQKKDRSEVDEKLGRIKSHLRMKRLSSFVFPALSFHSGGVLHGQNIKPAQIIPFIAFDKYYYRKH